MRINVYSQELTDEVIELEKVSNTGRAYKAAQLILHSSDHLHHPPADDDRSAVTFWLPSSQHRREDMARAFERIAAIFRRADIANPQLLEHSRAVPEVVTEVLSELQRATIKFPTWPTDPLHAVGVLGEEFGELTKAVMQATYEPHKNGPGAVRDEAVQTAAMALRFLASLDRYEYAGCPQHQQARA